MGALVRRGCLMSPVPISQAERLAHNLSGDYNLLISIQVATELPAICTINQLAYSVVKGTENISSAIFSNLVFFMFPPLYHFSYLISLFCIHFSTHNGKIYRCFSVTVIFFFSLHRNLAMPFNLTSMSKLLKFSQ